MQIKRVWQTSTQTISNKKYKNSNIGLKIAEFLPVVKLHWWGSATNCLTWNNSSFNQLLCRSLHKIWLPDLLHQSHCQQIRHEIQHKLFLCKGDLLHPSTSPFIGLSSLLPTYPLSCRIGKLNYPWGPIWKGDSGCILEFAYNIYPFRRHFMHKPYFQLTKVFCICFLVRA